MFTFFVYQHVAKLYKCFDKCNTWTHVHVDLVVYFLHFSLTTFKKVNQAEEFVFLCSTAITVYYQVAGIA